MAFMGNSRREVAAPFPELMKAGLAISALIALIFTIAASASNTWVYATFEYKDGEFKDEHAYQGIFVWENSHKIPNLSCSNDNVSTDQCNLLNGVRASVVLMLIAGILATGVYFYIFAGRASLFSPLAVFAQCLSGAQGVFGIMALSIYAQFKAEFYTDDDENQEYPATFEATYEGAWAVLLVATLISCIACIGGSVYMAVYTPRKIKLEDYDERQSFNP